MRAEASFETIEVVEEEGEVLEEEEWRIGVEEEEE